MQNLPGVGGVHPLPLHIFSGFLARRVMYLMHPLEYKAGFETGGFLLKFLIDITSQIHPKNAPDRVF